MSRRVLTFLIAGIVGFFVLFRFRKGIKLLLFRPLREERAALRFPNVFCEGEKALVSLVRGRDPDQMVSRAVDLLGGWEKIQIAGKKVLLKPNILNGSPSPVTTNPRVVSAVVKDLYRHGASEVWVGDMSALKSLPTRPNMEKTGIQKAAEGAGGRVIFFEEHAWVKVPAPQGHFLNRVYVTEWLFRADRIINLPVIKTHHPAVYSVALKNFIGATHGRQRPYFVSRRHWEEVIAELNLAYTPHLNIVDGTRIMVEGGPWEGRPEEPNLIIATGDRVAADLIGLALIKMYGAWPGVSGKSIWEQGQIKRAVALGLGITGPENMKLISSSGEEGDPAFRTFLSAIQSFLQERQAALPRGT